MNRHLSTERATTLAANWKPSRPVIGRELGTSASEGSTATARPRSHRYAAAYLTAFLILASIFAVYAAPSWKNSASVAYNVHSPISIDGDADLLSQAASELWPGTGLESDPILIRDYEIDASSSGTGVSIMNTRLYVSIDSCYIYSAFNSGLYLQNATNATILRCILESCGDGVTFNLVSDSIVADTQCLDSSNGMSLDSSSRLAFSNVTCDSNQEGIYQHNVTDSRFVNSSFSGNADTGIWLESCNMTSFDLCHANYNDYGLYATECYWLMFANSTGIGEGAEGAYVGDSTMFMLANSTFTGTIGGDGVSVAMSHHFLVSDNNLSGNNNGAYFDTCYDFSFQSNNITSNGYAGVTAAGCTNFGMRNNTCYEGSLGVMLMSSNGSVEENTVANSDFGVCVLDSDGCNIGQNVLSHNSYGIYIDSSADVDIWNNTCTWSGSTGIFGFGVTYSRLSNNNCSNGTSVLLLVYSDYNEISGNNCSGNSLMGMDLEACSWNIVQMNTCSWNYGGILLAGSVENAIQWNTCGNNTWTGISAVSGSDKNNISSNFVCGNQIAGITVSESMDALLTNNYCQLNPEGGIVINSSMNATLRQNNLISNGVYLSGVLPEFWYSHSIDQTNMVNGRPIVYVVNETSVVVGENAGQVLVANSAFVLVEDKVLSDATVGFEAGFSDTVMLSRSDCGFSFVGAYVYETDDFAISNCSFANCDTGVYAESGSFMMVDNCTLSGGSRGIFLSLMSDGYVKDNLVADEFFGIWLSAGDGLQVWDNICSQNVRGINVDGSSFISVNNNTCDGNSEAGIYLNQSDMNRIDNNSLADNRFGIYLSHTGFCDIKDNVMARNGIYLDGYDQEDWESHSISTSNTVNGRPVYYFSGASSTIIPDDGGQVILASCSGMVVPGGNLSRASVGISLGYTQYTNIANVNCSGGYDGIYLYHSDHSNITGSNMSGVENCGVRSLFETGDAVSNCTFAMDRIGVFASNTAEMKLSGNVFYGNEEEGVHFGSMTVQSHVWNNTFAYNNGALDNSSGTFLQAFDGGSSNTWFEPGSVHGWGNYWNDWTSPDADSDGIVDNPYNIRGTAGSRDMYPLVSPTTSVQPIPEFGVLLLVPIVMLLVVLIRRRGR